MYSCWKALPNNTVHMASDGSHIPETDYGAGAAVMKNENCTEEAVIRVGGKCSATLGMPSLTSEQVGIISALLLLHIICLKYGSPSKPSVVHLWIDNAEALRRVTTRATDDLRLKSYGARDHGDMQLMRHLHDVLPSNMHVKYKK